MSTEKRPEGFTTPEARVRAILDKYAAPRKARINELTEDGFNRKDAQRIEELERREQCLLEQERAVGLSETLRVELAAVQEEVDHFRQTAQRLYTRRMIERLRNQRLRYLCELRSAEATLEDLLSDYEVGKPVDESRAARVARAILDTPSTFQPPDL